MADEGDIVQTLTVEGISEAIAELENYGGTVARIFSKIGDEITSSGAAFESFGGAAGVALAGVGIVTAAVVAGFYELVSSASDAVEALVRLQAVTGDSIDNLSSFEGAVAASGFGLDNLGQAMVRMSQRFAAETPKIASDLEQLPIVLAKTSLAVEQASLALEKASEPVKHLGDAYADFALKLEAADIAIVKAQETVDSELDNFSSKLEKLDLSIESTKLQLEKLNDSYADLGRGVERATANVVKAQQAIVDFDRKAAAVSTTTKDYALNISNAEIALRKLQGTYTEADKEQEKQNQIKAAQLKLDEARAQQEKDEAAAKEKAAEEERKRQELLQKLQEAQEERERAIREERRREEELELKRRELALKLAEQEAAKKKAIEEEEQKRQEQALKLEEAKAAKEKLIAEEEIRRRAQLTQAREQEIKIQEAAIKLAEAEAAARKAVAENINTLTAAYVAMANGQKAVIEASVPMQKQLEGIVAAVNQIVKQKIDWKQITPEQKRQEELLTLATILKQIPDEENRVALASQLMGRGFAASLLLLDPEKIRKLQQSFKDLGLEITKLDEDALHKFRESSGELGYVWDTLKSKIGAIVSPIFADFFKALSKSLEDNVGWFKAFGETANQVFSVIRPFLPLIADGLIAIVKVLGALVIALGIVAAVGAIAFGLILKFLENVVISTATFVVNVGKAWTALVKGATDAASGMAQPFIDAWKAITEAGAAVWKAIKDAWNSLVKFASDAAGTVAKFFIDAFNSVLNPIKKVIDTIAGWIKTLVDAAKALWSALSGGGASLSAPGGGEGHAQGGLLGGQSGTDTNLGWFTRGEFVMKTAAVQKYGVPFMHGINSMQVPRFALGGLNTGIVPSVIGPATSASSRVLNLSIEGRSFEGMSVPEHTAASLERFAVHSQIASIGRRQSWRK